MTSRPWRCARLFGLAACLLLPALLGNGQTTDPEAESEYLFQPKDFPKGWVFFAAEAGADLNGTWIVQRDQDPKEAVVVCLGKPDAFGYLRTEREFENYELNVEWKFPTDQNGNSGILLHIVDKDMIWPKCLQVQLHRPTAGSILTHSEAKTDNVLNAKDLSKPLNEWNQCTITCEKDKLKVVMNGKMVGEVTGCVPQKGYIGLQSEGCEIHFRKLTIRPLKKTDP